MENKRSFLLKKRTISEISENNFDELLFVHYQNFIHLLRLKNDIVKNVREINYLLNNNLSIYFLIKKLSNSIEKRSIKIKKFQKILQENIINNYDKHYLSELITKIISLEEEQSKDNQLLIMKNKTFMVLLQQYNNFCKKVNYEYIYLSKLLMEKESLTKLAFMFNKINEMVRLEKLLTINHEYNNAKMCDGNCNDKCKAIHERILREKSCTLENCISCNNIRNQEKIWQKYLS